MAEILDTQHTPPDHQLPVKGNLFIQDKQYTNMRHYVDLLTRAREAAKKGLLLRNTYFYFKKRFRLPLSSREGGG